MSASYDLMNKFGAISMIRTVPSHTVDPWELEEKM